MPQSIFNVPEAEETGLSFVENAILKACNAALALADDSELMVDVLGRALCVYSAYYVVVTGPATVLISTDCRLDCTKYQTNGAPPASNIYRIVLPRFTDPTPLIHRRN